jgi:hypothetical protein
MAKEYRAIEYFTDAQDNDYPYVKQEIEELFGD